MHRYPYAPPPFYPVTPHVSPLGVATHVPLPPSPYGPGHIPLPGSYDPYAYGVPPYAYPYYLHGPLPVAPPLPQYPPYASQLHGLLHYSRIPRLKVDLAKPLEPLLLFNGSRVPAVNEVQSAVLAPTTKMRLVSADFPWTIDIDTDNPTENDQFRAGTPITVSILLNKLHTALRCRMTASEWLLCSKAKRAALSKAFRERCGTSGPDFENGLCWVDFLPNTWFYGLTKDDKVVDEVLMSRKTEVYETWVIVFGAKR